MDNLIGLAYLMGTLEHYRSLVMHPYSKGADIQDCIKAAEGSLPDAEQKIKRAYKIALDAGKMPLRQFEAARQGARHGRLNDYIIILKHLGYSENYEIPF